MSVTKVLLIDDDPVDLRAWEKKLSASFDEVHGADVVMRHAATLAEALRTESDWPHVVVADLNLPDSRDLETADALKRHFEFSALLVITGAKLGFDSIRALGLRGCHGMMSKDGGATEHLAEMILCQAGYAQRLERQKKGRAIIEKCLQRLTSTEEMTTGSSSLSTH